MSLEIKHNKGIELLPPQFICDGGIGKHLEKYEMLSHLNAYTFDIFIGRPGSGKTSLMVSFLTGKKDKKYIVRYSIIFIL